MLVGGWLPVDTPDNPQSSALYVTTDAGGSWSEIATPGEGQLVAAADFVGQKDGWVLTTPIPPSLSPSPAPATTPPAPSMTLWATTEGGRTWSPLGSRSSEIQIVSLDFVTNEVGWAETVNGRTGASGLLQTTDGGRTWTVVTPAISR